MMIQGRFGTFRSRMNLVLVLFLACTGSISNVIGQESRTISCDTAGTLPQLILCIRTHLPPRNTDSYIEPDPDLFDAWKLMIGQMLAGECSSIQIPPEFAEFYEIRPFTDSQNGRTYCVLMETGDANDDDMVDYGWGTYIVYPEYEHDLIIQVAHPREDLDTEHQGIRVFRETGARVFMMAGTSPDASTADSTCQPGYPLSDVCHNLNTIFENTFIRIMEWYQNTNTDYLAIQFHGMSETACPGVDVFMTHGVSAPPAPTDAVYRLKQEMEAMHPDWTISVPGDTPPCNLYGSTNIQGRICNGVPYDFACGTYASSYSGRFIHIESKPLMRESDDWIEAVHNLMMYQPVPATGWVSLILLLVLLGVFLSRHNRKTGSDQI